MRKTALCLKKQPVNRLGTGLVQVNRQGTGVVQLNRQGTGLVQVNRLGTGVAESGQTNSTALRMGARGTCNIVTGWVRE